MERKFAYLGDLGRFEIFGLGCYLKGFSFVEGWRKCDQCFYEYFDRYLACPLCAEHRFRPVNRILIEAHVFEDSLSEQAEKFVVYSPECKVRQFLRFPFQMINCVLFFRLTFC